MIKLSPGLAFSASLRNRLLMIAAVFLWMIVIRRDLRKRIEIDQNVAAAEAEDRDTPDEATLQHQLVEGPAVVGLYVQQGYTWAEAHALTREAQCLTDNRTPFGMAVGLTSREAGRSSDGNKADRATSICRYAPEFRPRGIPAARSALSAFEGKGTEAEEAQSAASRRGLGHRRDQRIFV